MTNKEYAEELRKLAQVYDDNDDVGQLYDGSTTAMSVYCHDKDSFTKAVRAYTKAFGGGTKSDDAVGLIFCPASQLKLRVFGFKDGICHRSIAPGLFSARLRSYGGNDLLMSPILQFGQIARRERSMHLQCFCTGLMGQA